MNRIAGLAIKLGRFLFEGVLQFFVFLFDLLVTFVELREALWNPPPGNILNNSFNFSAVVVAPISRSPFSAYDRCQCLAPRLQLK